jgi:GTP-binding protein YchF
MKLGFVGPSQSGKSTLFCAVTQRPLEAHIFGAGRPVLGTVAVPDSRLDYIASIFHPKRTVYAQMEIVDLPGLPLEGQEARRRELLAQVRDADGLVIVIPAFESDDPRETTWRDIAEVIELEFLYADLELIERRVEKLQVQVTKPTKTQNDDKRELSILERLLAAAGSIESFRAVELTPEEEKSLSGFRILSRKPVAYALNVAEAALGLAPQLESELPPGGIVLCAELEHQLALLDPAERKDFLEAFPIDEPVGPRLLRKGYEILGLESFFTYGEDECRAWTIRHGDDVVTAAGKIHSDLARGFIRAEVFSFEDFRAMPAVKDLKAAAKWRLEGKEYIVRDGDCIIIRSGV